MWTRVIQFIGRKPSRSYLPGSLPLPKRQHPSTGLTMSAIAVAIFDIILDSVGIGMGLFFFSYLTMNHTNLSDEEKKALLNLGFLEDSSKFGITIVFLYLVYMTTELLFAILLLIGVGQKSLAFCELWMTFALINFFIKGIQFIYFVALDKETLFGVGSFLVEPLIRLVMFSVIYSYTKKLKQAQWYQELDIYLVSNDANERAS